MMQNTLLILAFSFCLINFIFLIMMSNFLVKIADSISSFRKELDDFYYIKNSTVDNKVAKREESGLVDL